MIVWWSSSSRHLRAKTVTMARTLLVVNNVAIVAIVVASKTSGDKLQRKIAATVPYGSKALMIQGRR